MHVNQIAKKRYKIGIDSFFRLVICKTRETE